MSLTYTFSFNKTEWNERGTPTGGDQIRDCGGKFEKNKKQTNNVCCARAIDSKNFELIVFKIFLNDGGFFFFGFFIEHLKTLCTINALVFFFFVFNDFL